MRPYIRTLFAIAASSLLVCGLSGCNRDTKNSTDLSVGSAIFTEFWNLNIAKLDCDRGTQKCLIVANASPDNINNLLEGDNPALEFERLDNDDWKIRAGYVLGPLQHLNYHYDLREIHASIKTLKPGTKLLSQEDFAKIQKGFSNLDKITAKLNIFFAKDVGDIKAHFQCAAVQQLCYVFTRKTKHGYGTSNILEAGKFMTYGREFLSISKTIIETLTDARMGRPVSVFANPNPKAATID